MTAQSLDIIIYESVEYALIGTSTGELVTPEQFGMEGGMISTANYSGYIAKYAITNKKLLLSSFYINEKNGNYLPIWGVESVDGNYKDINYIIPFTGTIRIAKDFIRELYVHMGIQKATAFETVLDIDIKEGIVVGINDRSEETKWKRGAFKKYFEESSDKSRIVFDSFRFDLDIL